MLVTEFLSKLCNQGLISPSDPDERVEIAEKNSEALCKVLVKNFDLGICILIAERIYRTLVKRVLGRDQAKEYVHEFYEELISELENEPEPELIPKEMLEELMKAMKKSLQ